MYQVSMEEASEKLGQLLDAAQKGDEIIIMRNNIAVAKLVTVEPGTLEPQLGTAIGKIWVADDFDKTPEGFEDYG